MERRVVLIVFGAVVRRDLQTPREAGRATEELLVEPVAPPTERLGQGYRRGQSPGHLAQPDTHAAGADPGPQGTQGDRAPDPEAALPDLERGPRVAPGREVELAGR